MRPVRSLLSGAVLAAFAFSAASATPAPDPLDRLASNWQRLQDYAVTIDAHEVLGDRTADNELRYSFAKPHTARLDVLSGLKAGSTMLWDGGTRVTAFKRGLSIFKMHGGVWDTDLTSLRGNGILSPNMGSVIDCFEEHRDMLVTRDGPLVDGVATDEIALPYTNVSCPGDPPGDKSITLDVLDLSRATGLIVRRKRYAGDAIVESWKLENYTIDD